MKTFLSVSILFALTLLVSCSKITDTVTTTPTTVVDSTLVPVDNLINIIGLTYAVKDAAILKTGTPTFLGGGANAFHTFGLGDTADANALTNWNVKIVREFIGNLRENPLTGTYAIQSSTGAWLQPLQNVVNANSANGKITILCPFGWVDTNKNTYTFSGLNPSAQSFYAEYKTKMKLMAQQFKGQSDVWIEIWNEPYSWNNTNGYTDALWLKDVTDMVNNLRSVSGFTNIILVPGNGQGQLEDAINNKGKTLLQTNNNIVFDLHGYEKWMIGTTTASITTRLQTLKIISSPFYSASVES